MTPKRCPFCKTFGVVVSDARPLFRRKNQKPIYTTLYQVACRDDSCWMKPQTPWYESREAALRVWNRRLRNPRFGG